MKKPRSKRKKADSPRLAEMKSLVKEGYSLKMAMKLAGYAPSTIEKKASEYLKRMDMDELRKGLKIQTALSSFKALRVLDLKMSEAEKDSDQIKAADSILRSGKIHLTRDPGDTTIVFQLQTIRGQQITLNVNKNVDESELSAEIPDAIDIDSEDEENRE